MGGWKNHLLLVCSSTGKNNLHPQGWVPHGQETPVVWGRQGESKCDLCGRWDSKLQSKLLSSCPWHQGERGQDSPRSASCLVWSSLEGTTQDEPWDASGSPWLPVMGRRVHWSPSPQAGCTRPRPTPTDSSLTDAMVPVRVRAAERSPAPQSSRGSPGPLAGMGRRAARGQGRS